MVKRRWCWPRKVPFHAQGRTARSLIVFVIRDDRLLLPAAEEFAERIEYFVRHLGRLSASVVKAPNEHLIPPMNFARRVRDFIYRQIDFVSGRVLPVDKI